MVLAPQPTTWEALRQKADFPTHREALLVDLNGDEVDTGFDSILRTDGDPESLAVVSRKYRQIPHTEVLDYFDRVTEGMGEREVVSHQFPLNGARFYAKIRLPEQKFEFRAGGRTETLDLMITLRNSYDATTALRLDFGAYRLVCTNGLMIGSSFFRHRQIHLTEIDYGKLRDQFQGQAENFAEKVSPIFESMGETEVTESFLQDLEKRLKKAEVAQRHISRAFTLYRNPSREEDRPRTLWSLYNAFTDHTTHAVESELGNALSERVFGILSKAAA